METEQNTPVTPVQTGTPVASEVTAAPVTGALVDATLQDRAIAYLIDVAVVIGISILSSIISVILGNVSGALAGLVSLIGMIAIFAYIFLRDCLPFLNGVSIGKKVMKIQAVTMTGASLSGDFKSSALRNLPLLVAIVEVIILIVKKDEKPLQRLGDQLAKTIVVKTA
ncbi:RDD family protein [Luteolibacter sp. AS25]|uniref:RDD family protein n=1 Tax=Luteolibacter sp. AS25 TaxID=3135776 RepID=UPI00398A958D